MYLSMKNIRRKIICSIRKNDIQEKWPLYKDVTTMLNHDIIGLINEMGLKNFVHGRETEKKETHKRI